MKKTIDSQILRRFQRLSDWSQNTFGVTNFMIARFIHIVIVIALTGILFTEITAHGFSFFIILSPLLFGIVLFQFHGYVCMGESECKKNPIFRNPLRLRLTLKRYVLIFIVILNMTRILPVMDKIKYEDVDTAFNTRMGLYTSYIIDLFFLSIYFISCTPKPYKPSKAKALLDKAKRNFQNAGARIAGPRTAFQ